MTTDTQTLLRMEVPLVVILGERKMRVDEVRDFVPGTILELPKGAEEDLEIRINNRGIGHGTAVKIGENFGVRVTFVGDPASRIEAMGPEPEGEGLIDGMSPEDLAAALLSGQ